MHVHVKNLTPKGFTALNGLNKGIRGNEGRCGQAWGAGCTGRIIVSPARSAEGLGSNLLVSHSEPCVVSLTLEVSSALAWAWPERPDSLCSLLFWSQRHQEYLKMLAEREEALGESQLCPDLENSSQAFIPWWVKGGEVWELHRG